MEITELQVQSLEQVIQQSHLLVVDTVLEIKTLVETEALVVEAEVETQVVLLVLVTLQAQLQHKVLMVVQEQVN